MHKKVVTRSNGSKRRTNLTADAQVCKYLSHRRHLPASNTGRIFYQLPIQALFVSAIVEKRSTILE